MTTGISWQRFHSGKSKQNVFSGISWQHVSASVWQSAVPPVSCGTQMSSCTPGTLLPGQSSFPWPFLRPCCLWASGRTQTRVGSQGSPGSCAQLTLRWRLAWSVQSETQFPILGKMKWLFFPYILLTQNICFLTLLSVFILVRKCEKLTFCSLWRIRQTSKQWKHKLFSSILTC